MALLEDHLFVAVAVFGLAIFVGRVIVLVPVVDHEGYLPDLLFLEVLSHIGDPECLPIVLVHLLIEPALNTQFVLLDDLLRVAQVLVDGGDV